MTKNICVKSSDGTRQGEKSVNREIAPCPLRKYFNKKGEYEEMHASDIYLIFKIFDRNTCKALSCHLLTEFG